MDRAALVAAVARRLSPERVQHVLRVAETAEQLARRHGADPEKAWVAGVVHDFAREIPQAEAVRLSAARGLLAEVEEPTVALLHALLGAALVREELGIEDGEVLRAVARHTTGDAAMSPLDKVVYLADAIEPGRDFPGVRELRDLAWRDLDAAVLACLRMTVAALRRSGRTVDRRTLSAIASLAGGGEEPAAGG